MTDTRGARATHGPTARPAGLPAADRAEVGEEERILLGAGPGRAGGGRARAWLVDSLPIVALFGAFVGAWYLFSYKVLSPQRRFLLPPLHRVVDEAFLDGSNRSELLSGLWQSSRVAFTGLVISIVLGMAIAVVMSQARAIERAIFPFAVVTQAIPILAIAPLIGLFNGYNFKSRVIVCVMIAIFPIIANTLFGLLSADKDQHDLFTLHGAGRLTRLRKLQLPAAMPAIFAGFRISAGLSVIGAIVGDFIFRQGERGLGILIDVYRARLLYERLYGAIILSSVLGVAVFVAFGFLARRVTGHWYDANRRAD